jgi:hypothetical protein
MSTGVFLVLIHARQTEQVTMAEGRARSWRLSDRLRELRDALSFDEDDEDDGGLLL